MLPLDDPALAGEYLPDRHALAPIDRKGIKANRASVAELLGTTTGTTLQLGYDVGLLEARYQHANSLMWREAGALATTMSLVATALGLTSVLLGRKGDATLSAAVANPSLQGVGAVHIGTLANSLMPKRSVIPT